jgi:hypothetical protein
MAAATSHTGRCTRTTRSAWGGSANRRRHSISSSGGVPRCADIASYGSVYVDSGSQAGNRCALVDRKRAASAMGVRRKIDDLIVGLQGKPIPIDLHFAGKRMYLYQSMVQGWSSPSGFLKRILTPRRSTEYLFSALYKPANSLTCKHPSPGTASPSSPPRGARSMTSHRPHPRRSRLPRWAWSAATPYAATRASRRTAPRWLCSSPRRSCTRSSISPRTLVRSTRASAESGRGPRAGGSPITARGMPLWQIRWLC